MRSKTLSSDFTILRKDLTRFAPVWLGLSAYLILWTSGLYTSQQYNDIYYEPVAPIFAPIIALAVFGYLCDPTECNMVHSLPVRRERLFIIHIASACLMFLVPTGIFCAVTRDIATQTAVYRFVFMGVEFLLQFSIGVLCMMLTGRKIGAALLYIFIQCLPLIINLIMENLYLPLLPGLYLDNNYPLLIPSLLVANFADFMHKTGMRLTDWAFVIIYTLLCLGILAISILLYRRRKLEHAGDLLAVSWLNPIFAACSGITGASAMVLFDYKDNFVMLLLGCAIGYLSYWMLSKKTARVFTPKILGGFACLIAVLAGTMYLTSLDPLDRVYYVPEPQKVEKVSLNQGYYDSDDFYTTDPAVIETLTSLHADIAAQCVPEALSNFGTSEGNILFITYELKNGRTVHRKYYCKDDGLLKRFNWYLSQPIVFFRNEGPDFATVDVHYYGDLMYLDPRLLQELTKVVLTECREGRMLDYEYRYTGWHLTFVEKGTDRHTYLSIPETAVDTIAWLEANTAALYEP